MDIIVRDTKQIVEIHFADSTLLGLTLVLTKATSETVTGGIAKPRCAIRITPHAPPPAHS